MVVLVGLIFVHIILASLIFGLSFMFFLATVCITGVIVVCIFHLVVFIFLKMSYLTKLVFLLVYPPKHLPPLLSPPFLNLFRFPRLPLQLLRMFPHLLLHLGCLVPPQNRFLLQWLLPLLWYLLHLLIICRHGKKMPSTSLRLFHQISYGNHLQKHLCLNLGLWMLSPHVLPWLPKAHSGERLWILSSMLFCAMARGL